MTLINWHSLIGIIGSVVIANDSSLLKGISGNVSFSFSWAQSTFKRIDYIKRKATTAKVQWQLYFGPGIRRSSCLRWIPWSRYHTTLYYIIKKKNEFILKSWNCCCSLTSRFFCFFYCSFSSAIKTQSHGFFDNNRWKTLAIKVKTKNSHLQKSSKLFQIQKYSKFLSWKSVCICSFNKNCYVDSRNLASTFSKNLQLKGRINSIV